MDILLVMLAGMVVGRFVFTAAGKKANERLALVCTLVLIFSMGVMLGQKDNFLQDLFSLGAASFLMFLLPTAASILVVYLLTERFFVKKRSRGKEEPR